MKTVTLEQLLIAEGPLQALGQPIPTLVDGKVVALPQAVPFKASYHVSLLVQAVQSYTRPFREMQDALMKSLGQERAPNAVEKTAGVTAETVYDLKATGNVDEYNRQIKDAVATTITLDKWLLTVDVLTSFQVSPRDLAALSPLLIEDEPDIAAPPSKKKSKAK